MNDELRGLLALAIGLLGRIAFPPEVLASIVSAGGGEKQLKAYNLCDGSRTQGQIATELGLDPGNFSRTAKRWEQAGILARLGDGRDRKLLGLYRIAQ